MEKIIYANQLNSITVKISPLETLGWEIDNDKDLIMEKKADGIIITPDISAIDDPNRILRYTIEETGVSEEFELIIKKNTSENKSKVNPETNQETKSKLSEQFPKIPKILKVSPVENIIIPETRDMLKGVSWFFSDEKFNSHLELNAEGVKVNQLPTGMYTLYYQISDEKQKEIIIQSVVKQPAQPKEKKDNPQPPAPAASCAANPEPSNCNIPKSPDDIKKNWPKTVEKCAVEVSVFGQDLKSCQNLDKFPLEKTRSLLIGKRSRSQKVVDIDLTKYTQNTGKISRNHLKIWINDEYLMMKNIGSHRVLYSGKNIFPNQLAVLKIGGEIKFGDILLTIIRD